MATVNMERLVVFNTMMSCDKIWNVKYLAVPRDILNAVNTYRSSKVWGECLAFVRKQAVSSTEGCK